MIETGWQGEILVTTNATVWNERVEHYVRTLGMTVIASVDAVTPSVLEAIRVGVDASKVWRNIDRFQETVADTGQHVLLSMCHMVQNWAELGPFLAEADRRDVDANVILVNQPLDHSLLDLPLAALGEVVDRLGEEDASRRASLGRNRPIWGAQLQRLRAHLGSPVQIRPSAWRPTMSAVRAAERVRELAERSDTAPLILVITDNRLGSHPSDAPTWADALGLAEWAGASVDDLESLARQTIAEAITISVEIDEDAAYQVTIELPAGHASGIRSLHGTVLPPVPHGQDQSLVLAATLAP